MNISIFVLSRLLWEVYLIQEVKLVKLVKILKVNKNTIKINCG